MQTFLKSYVLMVSIIQIALLGKIPLTWYIEEDAGIWRKMHELCPDAYDGILTFSWLSLELLMVLPFITHSNPFSGSWGEEKMKMGNFHENIKSGNWKISG